MRVVPYRVLFEVDIDSVDESSKSKKTKRDLKYGKPTDRFETVSYHEDGNYYEVSTHDRGAHDEPGPYYQIAFRIEDPSPYSIDELSLHIDSMIYRNSDRPVECDLYYDVKTNLWYQRSRYEQDDEGNWKILSENDKSALKVDCITTSGVFKVVVCRNGKVIPGIDMPWIYVLPSAFSKKQYIEMLSELIGLHERLVCNQTSNVGIGELTQIKAETERIKKEITATEQLQKAISKAKKLPSEQQSKRYTKMSNNKVKHYDARVVREYVKSGMTGKTLGIEYYEEQDTYENRVIKYVLEQIKRRHQIKLPPPIDPEINVDDEAQREFDAAFATRKAKSKQAQTFYLRGNPSRSEYYTLKININGNCVSMPDHAPFSNGKNKYIKLTFYAHCKNEMLFFLQHLIEICDRMKSNPSFNIECVNVGGSEKTTGWNNKAYTLEITNIVSINGCHFNRENPDVSDESYSQKINEYVTDKRAYLTIKDGHFYIQEKEQRSIAPNDDEAPKMKESIADRIKRKVEKSKAMVDLWKEEEQLIQMLSDPWFQGISSISELSELKRTPKFRNNRYYSDIYNLICQKFSWHSILASSFDVNAFGVNSTQLVYEYWVFYKTLNKLQEIGFTINNSTSLVSAFQSFLQNNQHQAKCSNITLLASRTVDGNQIDIEIGYDVNRMTQKYLGDRRIQRRPDFSIKVSHGNTSHWFFLDAKYKCFTSANRPASAKVSYAQEIYDVALSKYIVDMGKIFSEDEMYWGDEIRGSFIIMANLEEETSALSENNRLYGDAESILKSNIHAWNQEVTTEVIDNKSNIPEHKYGAIVLAPGHEEELDTLFQLIFEYLDTNKKDDDPNLNFCWQCNSTQHVNREPKKTPSSTEERKIYKYHVTCKSCNSFRVDNHCISCGKSIIKHTFGNYHRLDDSVDNNQWAFLCPACGAPVNGLSKQFIDSLCEENADSHDDLPIEFPQIDQYDNSFDGIWYDGTEKEISNSTIDYSDEYYNEEKQEPPF